MVAQDEYTIPGLHQCPDADELPGGAGVQQQHGRRVQLQSVPSPVGGDLRFSDGTKSNALNFEIEKWVTNGASYVWVQVPVLSNNCSIWAFWGNSDATLPACATNGATWNLDFRGVWHLGEASGAQSF